jgi:beta-galactosidase
MMTVGETDWYRKTFTSEQAWNEKHVSIHFDRVYMNADIWLNGYHIGEYPYGYTPFHLELTPYT